MWAITIVSVTLLALVFLVWWLVERTLSMHSIRTHRREAFYWLAILVTFATGTAVGDLIAEKFSLGYLTTLLLFVAVIAVIAAVWKFTSINGVLAFWLAYIMTRPLGASTGDFLSQKGNQGLNLGTSVTSYVFLARSSSPGRVPAAEEAGHHAGRARLRRSDQPSAPAAIPTSPIRTCRIRTCRIRTCRIRPSKGIPSFRTSESRRFRTRSGGQYRSTMFFARRGNTRGVRRQACSRFAGNPYLFLARRPFREAHLRSYIVAQHRAGRSLDSIVADPGCLAGSVERAVRRGASVQDPADDRGARQAMCATRSNAAPRRQLPTAVPGPRGRPAGRTGERGVRRPRWRGCDVRGAGSGVSCRIEPERCPMCRRLELACRRSGQRPRRSACPCHPVRTLQVYPRSRRETRS